MFWPQLRKNEQQCTFPSHLHQTYISDLHMIVNVAAHTIWVSIFVLRQERHSLQTSFSDRSTHFIFLCIRHWIQRCRCGQRHRVMSHTWLLSATVVTPDHVWHGLMAVHRCCYKCNATAPSFHMASVWCRLQALLGYSTRLKPGQHSNNHLVNFCIKMGAVQLSQHWFSQTAVVLVCILCSWNTY